MSKLSFLSTEEPQPEPTGETTYRGYRITFDPPPIPDRQFDWQFTHEQYDGAPDAGDNRHGHAASLTDAMCEIDLIEDAPPQHPVYDA